MSGFTELAVPFIGLSILILMMESFTKFVIKALERFKLMDNYFIKTYGAWTITVAASFVICKYSNFNLFIYLGFSFNYPNLGYLMTACVAAGGVNFLKKTFTTIADIPMILGRTTTKVASTITDKLKDMFTKKKPPIEVKKEENRPVTPEINNESEIVIREEDEKGDIDLD